MKSIGESRDLETLVRERIERWRAGADPDAEAVLDEHPDLRRSKSLVVDLVLAEYSIRAAAGEDVTKHQYCERFPAYRRSIARQLAVEQYFLDQCPPDDMAGGGDWPRPGEQFFGFEIVEALGSGSWARVFLAREPAVGNRLVVIKISPFGTREAHTLGKLSHPSIVRIHSVTRDEVEGWTVICMPLEGLATADDLLDAAFDDGVFDANAPRAGAFVAQVARETLPLTELPPADGSSEQFAWNMPYSEAIARMGLQLAESLVAAHAAGVVHHDIKPSNILLAWSGRPMLLDFNLSADFRDGQEGLGGTLAYMAPELIARQSSEEDEAPLRFDPSCDIYSLGAV